VEKERDRRGKEKTLHKEKFTATLQHCTGMGCKKRVPQGRGIDPYGTGGTCPPNIY